MKNQLFINSLIAFLFVGLAQANSNCQDSDIAEIFNNNDSSIMTKEIEKDLTQKTQGQNPKENTLHDLEARSIECQYALETLCENSVTGNIANFESSVKITDNSFESTRKKTFTNGAFQESRIKLISSVMNPQEDTQAILYAGQTTIENTTLHQAHYAQVNPAPTPQQAQEDIVKPKLTMIPDNKPKITLTPAPATTKSTPVITPTLKPILQPKLPEPTLVLRPILQPKLPEPTPVLRPILQPKYLEHKPTTTPIATPTPQSTAQPQQENIVKRAAKEAARRIVHNGSKAANFVKDQIVNHPVRTGIALTVATLAVADWFWGGSLSQGAMSYAQSFFESNNDQGISPADNLDECEAPGTSVGYCIITNNTSNHFSMTCEVESGAFSDGFFDMNALPTYFADGVSTENIHVQNPISSELFILDYTPA